jgi:hypothetical protein
MLLALLSACRTTPPAPPTALSRYLPSGARAYVYLDVSSAPGPARAIVQASGMEGRTAELILERTKRVAAALGVADDEAGAAGGAGSGAFVLAASGRFPGFVFEAQLEDEEAWTRRIVTARGGRIGLWRRGADGLELGFPEPRVATVARGGDPESDVGMLETVLVRAPEAPAPGATQADAHTAVAVLPVAELAGPFGTRGIELRDVELRADPVDAADPVEPGDAGPQWRIGGSMRLEDERTARAVTALIRLLAISMISDTGANPEEAAESLTVERTGNVVTFDGIVLAERFLLDALEQYLILRAREAT